MTDTVSRLKNWGEWTRSDTGKPQGYPSQSPMFTGANPRDMREPGWGPDESAPEDVPIPIDVPDAELIDKIINDKLDDRLKFALTIEYADNYRRRPGSLQDAVNEATAALDNILKGGSKKVLILDLHAKGKTAPKIAEIVGVSHQYVYQITVCK